MPDFIPGLELCRRYYHEAVSPLRVIRAGLFDSALRRAIRDPRIRTLLRRGGSLGGIDEISANSELCANARWRRPLQRLYGGAA